MVVGVGPTVNWSGCALLGDALVKGIGGDWIANSLGRRRRIVDSISTPDDRFRTEPVSNANTWRKIGLVCTNGPSAHTQAGIFGQHVAETDDASVQIFERLG